MLYQLSYSRSLHETIRRVFREWWMEKDSNLRRHTPAGLQPAPFSHSGIHPGGVVLNRKPAKGKRIRKKTTAKGKKNLGAGEGT